MASRVRVVNPTKNILVRVEESENKPKTKILVVAKEYELEENDVETIVGFLIEMFDSNHHKER